MAGIHGKNASLRVSTNETVLSGVAMWGLNGSGVATANTSALGSVAQVLSASNRNWKYDRDRTLIQFTTSAVQGTAIDVNDANGVDINTQSRLINYAGGAIHLGQHPGAASGVFAMAVAMNLSQVGNLVGDNRNFTVRVESDTLDSTVMGETWKTFEEGLLGFSGSLDGLVIDNFWYKQAIQTLSGLAPRTVIRFQIDPRNVNTYYQGTVIFPSIEIGAGYDSLATRNLDFQGRGPLDLVENGVPFFKVNESS